VFTPDWLVENMLDLIKGETERIDARFLEPACGSGNFLVPILQRKLAAVELKFRKFEFEKRHYALLALMCAYGVELLEDNIAECRANMLEVFSDYLSSDEADELYRAASYVLAQNLLHGDAMTMRALDGAPSGAQARLTSVGLLLARPASDGGTLASHPSAFSTSPRQPCRIAVRPPSALFRHLEPGGGPRGNNWWESPLWADCGRSLCSKSATALGAKVVKLCAELRKFSARVGGLLANRSSCTE
jgi:hypothetical protein